MKRMRNSRTLNDVVVKCKNEMRLKVVYGCNLTPRKQ